MNTVDHETRSVTPRAHRRPFTLADGLAQSQDNFLLLRVLAAAAVIYGHGYAMVPQRGLPDVFVWLGWGSGTIAVDSFFLTSGFLVAGSFLRRRNVLEFIWARALRVLPAYTLCMIGCAFVLGACYTSLPLLDYLKHPATRGYVLVNLHFNTTMAWYLPGVFTDNPRRSTINGSIWTLPAEVRMYLWVALLGGLGILSRRAYCNVLLAGLFVLGLLAPDYLLMVPQPMFVRLAGFFALGVFCYINRDIVPANGRLVLTLAALAWLLRNTPVYPFAFGLTEASFVFWFAYRTLWRGYNRFGDYSYGIYLWGFPMQQLMAHYFPTAAPLTNAALGLPLATLVAVVSWHFVEKPALLLKSMPRKRWQRHLGSA
jgi:peptidoglycan/LPS O-acetylase OafA/YrhL